MKNVENFYEDCIEKWRINLGKGTMIFDKKTDTFPVVLGILQRLYNKSPTYAIIVVENFKVRSRLIDYLTKTDDEENNKEFQRLIKEKTLRIFTSDFMNTYHFESTGLFVTIGNESVTDATLEFLRRSKFRLTILTDYLKDNDLRLKLYEVNNVLEGFDQNEINNLRMTTPVEEIQIPVEIDSESVKEELEKCDKYITQSINIFGSFDIIQQCRVGNPTINISAEQYCNQIALDNGWNDTMDMTVPINVQIDEMYNPCRLRERASMVYDVIRRRSQLLSDYEGKLIEVVNLIREHKDEKFIVISKRGEFAAKVTEYINKYTTSSCADYHEKLDNIPAVDINGNELYYKSGINAGKRRMMGAQAQKTLNETKFNFDMVNVLSLSNAPDKSLNINVSNVIITSPQCDTIEQYIYRLNNVNFGESIKLYTLYIKGSGEQKSLLNREISANHKIVNNCEIKADFDENVGAIFVE